MKELQGIKKELADIKEVKKEVKVLSNRLNDAFQIIHQQQLFLETVDNRARQCNLVITGLSEGEDGTGRNDIVSQSDGLDDQGCGGRGCFF